MSMIRLQNSTPSEYCAQSRDFQLLCRLYDTVFNGIQFDISTMTSILSTRLCRDTILPLLQTKVGFFTNKETDNTSLRYFLEVFPLLLKNKGTSEAIQQAVITFLKINKVISPVTIYYNIEETVLENRYTVPDHTILIGINCGFLDTTLLEEVLKYILPAGIGYYFYFYTDISVFDKEKVENKAVLLYSSNNINSQLRGSSPSYSKDEANRLIGAVDTMLIASNDSLIPTENGTFDAGDTSLFIGQFEGEDSFNTFIQTLSITPISGNILMYNSKEYLYESSSWHEVTFFGTVSSTSVRVDPQAYEIVYSAAENKYKLYNGSSWVDNNTAVYIFMNFLESEDE